MIGGLTEISGKVFTSVVHGRHGSRLTPAVGEVKVVRSGQLSLSSATSLDVPARNPAQASLEPGGRCFGRRKEGVADGGSWE